MAPFTAARVLVSRALDFLVRSRRDNRLSEEVETHLDLLTRDFIAKGLSPAEARRAARRAFGGIDQLTSLYRDQRGLPLIDTFIQDVRFAGRLLTRDRGFAATAVCVLGIGIGVNNMFFTILNAHTIRGLPISEASRVVYISTFDDRNRDGGLSFPDFLDLRDTAASLSQVSAFLTAPAIVAGDGHAADRFTATFLSANAFDVIGVHPRLGRGFGPDDDRPGSAAVVLLGNGAWQSRYGGDAQILGRSILVNGTPATIVGVIPDRSGFPTAADIWLPLRLAPGLVATDRHVRNLRVLARIREDVAFDKSGAEVDTIIRRSAEDNQTSSQSRRGRVIPVDQQFLGRLTDPAWMAFIAAGFLVVLISCANVANLMLAHSIGRGREFAIRTSLGASRRRILRQLVVEGIVLAAAGAVIGFGVSRVSVRLFRSAIPANALPYWMDYSVDARVIAGLILVALLTVILFALLPALQASKADVNAMLKEGGRPGAGRRSRRWTTVFLTAEFALAVVLLSQVAASVRDADPPLPSDRTLDTDAVITAALTLPDPNTPPQERIRRFELVDQRVGALPGITSVSFANALPLMGGAEAPLRIVGVSASSTDAIGNVRTVLIGEKYFHTLGVDLIQGRELTDRDGTPANPVCLVNERLAAKFFPGESPLGRQIAVLADDRSVPSGAFTIVGVAADIRQSPRGSDPVVYLSYRAAPPTTVALILRTDADPARVVPLLRNAILSVDPQLPVYRIQSMSEVIRTADWNRRLSRVLVLFITCIAVALSTVGLYAVTAHGVSQHTQEIGVRMALGARSSAVVLLLARRILVQLVFGFLAGIICTIAWNRLFGSANGAAQALAPETLAVVAATLAITAIVACFIPARRAIRLDPVAAIRGV